MYNKLQEKEEEMYYYNAQINAQEAGWVMTAEETAAYQAHVAYYDEECLDIPF
jgi:hypothetical protein